MLDGLLHRVWTHFWTFDWAVILITWVTALAAAGFTYVVQTEGGPKTWRGFARFCIPPEMLRHPSIRLDIFFNMVMHFIRMPAGIMLSNLVFAELSYAALTALFGAHAQLAEPWWIWVAIMAVGVLIQDFMTFYAHVLQHRIGVFWELHKVHHSVEFLIPLSNRRFHPIQAIMDNWFTMVPLGLFLGIISYVLSLPVHDYSIIGLDALFVMNMLSFYHLRHSHVPMRYGWLERHLISPAQHQLHHSREERHWDKNFGFCFSWWDRMWGTVVYSDPHETFRLGLPDGDQVQYDSVLKLFITPVRNLSLMGWGGARRLLTRPQQAPVPVPVPEAAALPPVQDAA